MKIKCKIKVKITYKTSGDFRILPYHDFLLFIRELFRMYWPKRRSQPCLVLKGRYRTSIPIT